MEFEEKDFLLLSGIQHFAFCRRQWALIHLEMEWADNLRTAEGELLHEKAHNPYVPESRGKVFLSRAMPIFSRSLGFSGECDVVEFRQSEDGIPIQNREGKYLLYPVEYKHGKPKESNADRLQLTAQAMCLEEMFLCKIDEGAVYYAEPRRREKVQFTDDLRHQVQEYSKEMHSYFDRGLLPKAKFQKGCWACSLKDICMPKLNSVGSAKEYNQMQLGEEK